MCTEHFTHTHPPQDQWQHKQIFLGFLPACLLWFSQSREQLSAAGVEEAAGMPRSSSCVIAGRTKASRAAHTVINWKDSCNLAGQFKLSGTVLMMQTNDSKL